MDTVLPHPGRVLAGASHLTGVGLGLRMPIAHELFARPELVDFVEIHPENFMGRGGRYERLLARACETWPVASHGLTCGFGGAGVSRARLDDLAAFLARIRTPWHSDHLSLATDGVSFSHDLLPIPRTRAVVDRVVAHIADMRRSIARPVLVENISYYASYSYDEMSEVDFLWNVVERADAWLLLDVNNVFVNSRNFHFDPFELIARFPLHRVRQIHIAGHDASDPLLVVDTHDEAVAPRVLELLAEVLLRTGPVPVLLERDGRFPKFGALVEEVERVREVVRAATKPWAVAV